jgi:hypothetical protein
VAAFDLRAIARSLLGVSAYQPASNPNLPDLDSRSVEETRRALGGQLQQVPTTFLRWYYSDLESAQYMADQGNLKRAAQLYRAFRRDGVIAGLLGTRTSGLVRLPKRFYGDPELCAELQARNGTRSIFDDMCPSSELGLLAADGICLGVGVGEMVPVPGRAFPIFIRLDPEFLQYRWQENRWYYESVAGLIPITPGDGRWVLHTPGGRIAPWNSGCWPAVGRSFINKEHAIVHRLNFSDKLANPARVAKSPLGAGEKQKQGFFEAVMAWATDTVFALPPGWDVELLETKGTAIDVFQKTIDSADKEVTIVFSGQSVTTDGGAGFQNADSFKAIRLDLVQDTGEGLAYTVNTQILPAYTAQRKGPGAIPSGPCVEWNTDQPKDLVVAASSLTGAAGALKALQEAVSPVVDANGVVLRAAPTGPDGQPIAIDAHELFIRFRVPVKGDVNGDGEPEHIASARALSVQPLLEAA